MATKLKRAATTPRDPDRKWVPFHGGVGRWLSEAQTETGPNIFCNVTSDHGSFGKTTTMISTGAQIIG